MRCAYPFCQNTTRTRGLCHPHYQQARAYIRAGKATEENLVARGMMTPSDRKGGSPIGGSELLLMGSPARGEAFMELVKASMHPAMRARLDLASDMVAYIRQTGDLDRWEDIVDVVHNTRREMAQVEEERADG